MIFWQNVCISIDESLEVPQNSFGPPHNFLVENVKINFFEEKLDLSADFIESKFGLLQTCLSDMKKHKTLEMLLRADFLCIFKILCFSRFLKIISSTC